MLASEHLYRIEFGMVSLCARARNLEEKQEHNHLVLATQAQRIEALRQRVTELQEELTCSTVLLRSAQQTGSSDCATLHC